MIRLFIRKMIRAVIRRPNTAIASTIGCSRNYIYHPCHKIKLLLQSKLYNTYQIQYKLSLPQWMYGGRIGLLP